jgi:hypothetical protein
MIVVTPVTVLSGKIWAERQSLAKLTGNLLFVLWMNPELLKLHRVHEIRLNHWFLSTNMRLMNGYALKGIWGTCAQAFLDMALLKAA